MAGNDDRSTRPTLRRRHVLAAGGVAAGSVFVPAAAAPAVAGQTATQKVGSSPWAPGLALKNDQAWHLARRTAHAPSGALAEEIRRTGTERWLELQLDPASVDDDECDALLARHFTWLDSTPNELQSLAHGKPWLGAPHVARATIVRQLFTRRVLQESMVEFFSDLVYVPFTSDKNFGYVIDFDREVVRRHAMGRFSDLLRAALRHPALLLFLDNETNVRGAVNENLGRELLELHTVGVVDVLSGQPNYTQAEVRDSSLILTGHTRDFRTDSYRFDSSRHQTGPVSVMGFAHPNARASDGPALLDAYATHLATHPATARRVAHRLAQRFVSDEPPVSLVTRLSETYLASSSDIVPVLRDLFASAEFRQSVGHKIRRPAEMTGAAIRSTRPRLAVSDNPSRFPRASLVAATDRLSAAGHYPRGWPAVNGYPDVADHWMSTQAMVSRLRAARSISRLDDPELPADGTWAELLDVRAGARAHEVAGRIFLALTGFSADATHRNLVARTLVGSDTDVASTRRLRAADLTDRLAEGVFLVFASPYFTLR